MQGGYFASQQPVLPAGWQMAYTQQGQVYYVDHNTQTTHWNPPQMSNPPVPQYQQPHHHHHHHQGGRGGRGGFNGRGGRVGIDSTKRKTKMCMNWESGSCSWGDRCAFAHGATELNPIRHEEYPGQQQAAPAAQ